MDGYSDVPAINSDEFRKLTYKQKLEILSLRFFNPEEYSKLQSTSEPSLLDLPEIPELAVPDTPIVFLDNFWAGYSSKYRKEWYRIGMLDEYNVKHKHVVNVNAFNFPFLCLDNATFNVFTWLKTHYFIEYSMLTIIHAAKVYMYLSSILCGIDNYRIFSQWKEIRMLAEDTNKHASEIYRNALDVFKNQIDVKQLNDTQKVINICDKMLRWVYLDKIVVHEQARNMNNRWFFPLVPSFLYMDRRFHIYNWGWLKD